MIPRQRTEPDHDSHRDATVLQLPPARYEAPPGTVNGLTLIDRTGLTYRQVDYWCRTGLLMPVGDPTPGSGSSRYFPLDQVHRAATIRWLLEAGIALQTIRQVIDELLETGTAYLNPTLTVHLPEDY